MPSASRGGGAATGTTTGALSRVAPSTATGFSPAASSGPRSSTTVDGSPPPSAASLSRPTGASSGRSTCVDSVSLAGGRTTVSCSSAGISPRLRIRLPLLVAWPEERRPRRAAPPPDCLSGPLVDRGLLDRPGERRRVVRQDVGRDRGVDRYGDVRVDERHRGALRQLLAGERHQLLVRQRAIFLGHRPSSDLLGDVARLLRVRVRDG